MTALLCCLLTTLAQVQPSVEESVTVRVMTYNIHHAEGSDGQVDLDRIAAIVHRSDPDVVCLQEVDRGLPRTGGLDFPALLEEKLNLRGVFGVNYEFEGGEYGTATFTRHPIVRHENYPLPNPNEAEPRGCLRTTLHIGGREVDVLNTHLGLKPDEREKQAARLVELVREVPTILVGDFNEGMSDKGLRQFRKVFTVGCPGVATQQFEGSRETKQIDFLFAAHGVELLKCKVLDSPMIRVASDHRPVVAEFEIGEAIKLEGEE